MLTESSFPESQWYIVGQYCPGRNQTERPDNANGTVPDNIWSGMGLDGKGCP